jgi:ComF family protein
MILFFKELLASLISQPYCECCRIFLNKRAILCDRCRQNVKELVAHRVSVTKMWSIPVYSLGEYQDPLRTLILAKHRSRACVAHELGLLLAEHHCFEKIACDVLVPIPLHRWRKARRGYNQAMVMAKALGDKRNIMVIDLLRRSKNTKFQADLSLQERAENVRGVFELTLFENQREAFEGKNIVLIDDLVTTGSTLKEAAKVIKMLKPASITALVVARTAR